MSLMNIVAVTWCEIGIKENANQYEKVHTPVIKVLILFSFSRMGAQSFWGLTTGLSEGVSGAFGREAPGALRSPGGTCWNRNSTSTQSECKQMRGILRSSICPLCNWKKSWYYQREMRKFFHVSIYLSCENKVNLNKPKQSGIGL